MSPKPNKGVVAGIPNKVPDQKGKWFFVERGTWEFDDDTLAEDRVSVIPRSWGEYNEALTLRTTQAKFND